LVGLNETVVEVNKKTSSFSITSHKLSPSTLYYQKMSATYCLFVLLFSLLSSSSVHSLFSLQHPRPVHAMDPVAFEGRWFQTHGSMVSAKTFQKNGYCVTVDYLGTESDETDFRVINSEK
jgi:hypothetical protein